MNRETVLKKIEHLANRSNQININGIDVVELMHHAYQLLSMCKGCNNDRPQPAPKSAEWIYVPVSVEERLPSVANENYLTISERGFETARFFNGSRFEAAHYEGEITHWLEKKSPPRYVTDEEIDAMYQFDDDPFSYYKLQRQAAKAMRDMIFGGVKP